MIGYVVNSKKGYELERSNISGENSKELFRSMQVIQNQNLRCKNNTISIVLSPEISDGKIMTDEQWKELTRRFIFGLGVHPRDAQYISFIHTEKEHKHVHIILNRVKDDGALIQDSFIGKRSHHIAHRIAKEMGLLSAREIQECRKINKKESLKLFRKDFIAAHEFAKSKFPGSLEKYSELMEQKGFEIRPTINKQGNIQGFRVYNRMTKEDAKLSQIDRKIKLDNKFFNNLINERIRQKSTEKIQSLNENHNRYKIRR